MIVLLVSALIAQNAPEAGACNNSALRIIPPAHLPAPIMPFNAPVPPAKVVISTIVSQDGHLITETISGGSGYSALDIAAYRFVHSSSFVPKMVDCKPVTAYQFFIVDFSQTPPAITPAEPPVATPPPQERMLL